MARARRTRRLNRRRCTLLKSLPRLQTTALHTPAAMRAPPDPVQKTLEDTPARVTNLAASKMSTSDGKGYLLALEARSIIALRQRALLEALAEQAAPSRSGGFSSSKLGNKNASARAEHRANARAGANHPLPSSWLECDMSRWPPPGAEIHHADGCHFSWAFIPFLLDVAERP